MALVFLLRRLPPTAAKRPTRCSFSPLALHCPRTALLSVSSFSSSPPRAESSPPSASSSPSVYSSTLNLPQTKFSLRANAAVREPLVQKLLSRDLYKWQRQALEGSPQGQWVLLDGPPYANGSLHMGHFLNKVLKDIVNRFQLLRGKQVHFTPGWDCHGLPIELKALSQTTQHSSLADGAALPAADQQSPMTIRRQAHAFAQEAVEDQGRSFERWGIMADWDRPYLTLQPRFEANQLEVGPAQFFNVVFFPFETCGWKPTLHPPLGVWIDGGV